MARLQELVTLLDGATSLAIVCHDNPDPDCIASAFALGHIAMEYGVDDVAIVYGGDITHQQNRAFVNALDIDLEGITATDLEAFDLAAFVDHTGGGIQSQLPPGTPVNVIIDHHPASDLPETAYVDVREDYGATSSILVEYLHELDVEVPSQLASALLFGLHRECLDYVRAPTIHEYEAALYLSPDMDMEWIEELYGSAFTAATLDAIGEAIHNRRIRGAALVSSVGTTAERDALAQAADYLLNLEGVSTVFVFGIVVELIHVSARSIDPRVDVGDVMRNAFGDVGSAGGHQDRAGAQIPLGLFAERPTENDDLQRLVADTIVDRVFDTMRLDTESDIEA